MPPVANAKFVATLPWFVTRSWWHRTTYREGLECEIVVQPGPDGRPGERLVVPGRPLWRPKVVHGASRSDFGVVIDRHGSALNGVCVGHVAERGEPGPSARETLEYFWEKGWTDLTPVSVEEIGGEEAFRYHAALPRGTRLTEWKFAHAGWLYAVGVLNHAPDDSLTVMRVRRALDSWEWLES
jgi:hypothetical protein